MIKYRADSIASQILIIFLSLSALLAEAAESSGFVSSSNWEDNQRRHRLVPNDDIWGTAAQS